MKFILRIFIVVSLLIPALAHAETLPLNPEFVEWSNRQAKIVQQDAPLVERSTVSQAYPLTYRPSPVDRTHLGGESIVPDTPSRERYPVPTETRYDLRDHGFAPGSRDQNPYGTCWAFGALAAMESSALKKGWANPDFSEKHLAYYAYNNVSTSLISFDKWTLPYPSSVYDQGGNSDMAVAMLSRWTGAVGEATEPYTNMGPCAGNTSLPAGVAPSASAANAARLSNTFHAPGGAQVVGNIKYLLKTYGAVHVSINWQSSYFKSSTNAFYNHQNTDSNHAVTVVGWDDSYSRYNFATAPVSNGAWIVRNSWGSSWGDGGYFYVSYEDKTIKDKGGWAYETVAVADVDHQYLYDQLGHTATYSNSGPQAYVANIFQATAKQEIKAVALHTAGVGDTVSVKVYAGITAGQPSSGTLAYQSASQVLESPGFHTIPVTTPVTVEQGQRFSVVVRIDSATAETYVAVENPIDDWSSKARASAGQSYVSENGSSWTDATTIAANANVTVRAMAAPVAQTYTISAEADEGAIISPSGDVVVAAHDGLTFTISAKSGYRVTDVLVDGVSVGTVSSYAFQDVTSNHIISVKTTLIVGHTITASAHVGGLISPSGEKTVHEHGDQTYTIGAVLGFRVTDVIVDGSSVGVVPSYTFSDVTSNHSIHVKVAKKGNGYAEISAFLFTLELKPNGTLWAWGWNEYGELGDGTTTERWSPYLIGETYASVYAGTYFSFGIKKDGSLWAWGRNLYGVLGDGTTTNRLTPVKVGDDFVAVAAGVYHALGLKTDGTLWTWGHNYSGQLGDGSTTDHLRPVQIGEGYTAIAAGMKSSYGLKADGTIWAWGSGFRGGLGNGTYSNQHSPVQVNGAGYCAIAADNYSAHAMKPDGTIWSWGENDRGQLGDGTTTYRSLPKQIGSDFVDYAVGGRFSYGIKNDGTLWTWGDNINGQLGNGGTADRHYVPTQVESGIKSIYAGNQSGYIVKNDGSLWACGLNKYGQLGDGTTISRNVFVKIRSGEPLIAPVIQLLLADD